MARKTSLTSEQKKDIIARLKAGETTAVLAKEYDRTGQTICNIRRENDITKPKRKQCTIIKARKKTKHQCKCPRCQKIYSHADAYYTGTTKFWYRNCDNQCRVKIG